MSSLPDFFLGNPVARSFIISHPFNEARNYSFAPTRKQLHEGVDIVSVDAQGRPTAVLAAQRGTVTKVGWAAQGYGKYVRIKHEWGDDTFFTWYGHLSEIIVEEGQFVLAGQKLGVAGTTGNSTGIHLHLTLQHIGHGLDNYVVADVVDPTSYFKIDAAPTFDEAKFLADVTIPDGTKMQPGQEFEKKWRVRNTGTSTWTDAYRLAFVSGDQMGAPDEVALLRTPIAPGEVLELAVTLTAPTAVGTHRSLWRLKGADGIFPDDVYAEIEVEGTAEGVNNAVYVADVTIPDGTRISAGESFEKIWRVRNTGTTTWNNTYSLRFVNNDRMGGPDSVPLTGAVAPGDVVQVAVSLVAPAEAGRHRSDWKLHSPGGEAFGNVLFADIQVPAEQPPDDDKLSQMDWIADVTIPDLTVMKPGASFVKTWRIRNTGETTWASGYELAFFGDNQMGGPESVSLPTARPGDIVEVSVPLVAPTEPGEHRSTWKGRDPQGNAFEFDMFALIVVEDTAEPPDTLDEMTWVADVTVEDGMEVRPGEKFLKTWRVRNTGSSTWGAGYELAFFGNDQMGGPESVTLPAAQPGDEVEVSVSLRAPTDPGLHSSSWKARDAEANFFEYVLWTLVEVVDPSHVYDLLPYLRGDGRLCDLEFNWQGGGRQRIQTQVEGNKFYHVKWQEWEELWADDYFIYRGTDTSPGNNEIYQLSENGQHGSPWIPRRVSVGQFFRRTPKVTFRYKDSGELVPGKQFIHVTWIKLEAVHSKYRLPSGVVLDDVAVLSAHEDVGGTPKTEAFEHYYYARNHGLVAWEGELGQSFLVAKYHRGTVPDLQREVISWL